MGIHGLSGVLTSREVRVVSVLQLGLSSGGTCSPLLRLLMDTDSRSPLGHAGGTSSVIHFLHLECILYVVV